MTYEASFLTSEVEKVFKNLPPNFQEYGKFLTRNVLAVACARDLAFPPGDMLNLHRVRLQQAGGFYRAEFLVHESPLSWTNLNEALEYYENKRVARKSTASPS